MSRIRTIKPEFWTSEQVVECSPTARLLFIGLWNFVDDGGNIVASPKAIKMKVFPGDDFSVAYVEGLISELLSNRLLVSYRVGQTVYWNVTGWKHQKIEKPSFKHPKIDDGEIVEYSTTIRRPFDDAPPAEGSLPVPECTVPESINNSRKSANLSVEDFSRFYSVYPKHTNRKAAEAKFSAAVRSGVSPERIIDAASRFAEAHRRAGTEKQFIPAPNVWLHNGRYDDEDLPQAPRAGPSQPTLAQISNELNRRAGRDFFGNLSGTNNAETGPAAETLELIPFNRLDS